MSWSDTSSITELTLVRHGQASYLMGDNYDRLSATGERQARCLGEYWLRRKVAFERIYTGPAERHRRSADIVAETVRSAGRSWPDAVVVPEFDEFPGEDVVRKLTPILRPHDAKIAELAEAFEAASDELNRHGPLAALETIGKEAQLDPAPPPSLMDARKRTLDRLFHEVASRWVAGDTHVPGLESWAGFIDRVARGIERIRTEASAGERVVVFTSSGPTAVVASLSLGISSEETFQLVFRPRNASYSEFRLKPNSLELHSFNNTPHLDQPALLTYR